MRAIVAGVFGAPTYVMGNETFRNQHRRGSMAEALGLDDRSTHGHGNGRMGKAS
jgi:2-hydroxychromene-2-carboxylate isomerase